MKTIAIGSLFVLLAIVAGVTATNPAFADHATASVSLPAGSSVPGCEETNECYIPHEVTIDVGGEVTWSNDDTAAHTVTGGSANDGPSGVFDSSLFMAGATFSHKFDTAGTYPYFCMVHPWMEGVVVVQEAGAEEAMDEHEGEMMNMEGDATATGMLSDGTKVSIWTSVPTKGEMMEINVEFEGAEHVNHDIKVTQNGNTVLNDMGAHHHDGKGAHMTKALSSSDPVDITITFQGYGVDDPKTGPIGEVVKFSKVVPEFGTIAMMILAVAIISIVAVTAKSRVIPRF
ncbi:PEFG-CTERM sorting domain-containing protein [Nitrosopumilus sp. K4]|uniref:PEFG-CTERM sorting domain-containing protein n=1 Tax=Nitrosopumilus sp. K4 TaxID=2795383 RepID=UPI001BAB26F2|nr:PEFG-CTERM sorting domain-containing protein [Nitrosopumilus sp. K4]QUC64724.1 PEFG-CTERM sorting domain-containing protein [Nitrosopumilus sp. K4]